MLYLEFNCDSFSNCNPRGVNANAVDRDKTSLETWNPIILIVVIKTTSPVLRRELPFTNTSYRGKESPDTHLGGTP
eukprot:4770978-Amphidinium_carterae.1